MLQAHVVMLTRRAALAAVEDRLSGRPAIPDDLRAEVFDAMRLIDPADPADPSDPNAPA